MLGPATVAVAPREDEGTTAVDTGTVAAVTRAFVTRVSARGERLLDVGDVQRGDRFYVSPVLHDLFSRVEMNVGHESYYDGTDFGTRTPPRSPSQRAVSKMEMFLFLFLVFVSARCWSGITDGNRNVW